MPRTAPDPDQHLDSSFRREDTVLERLATVAAAIDDEWVRGASRVQELQRQAELVRDEVRERTAALEDEQAVALLELARLRSMDDIASLLGVSGEGAKHLLREAARRVASRSLEPAAQS